MIEGAGGVEVPKALFYIGRLVLLSRLCYIYKRMTLRGGVWRT